MTHHFAVKVWYEDTDMAGVVYHANYLKFIERARSQWVAEMGVDQSALREAGTVFVVRRVEADYLASAVFADDLLVTTRIRQSTPVRWVLDQDISRDGVSLFRAVVTIVAVGPKGKPVRLPAELCRKGG